MSEFRVKSANDDTCTELGKLYNELRLSITKYRKAVNKVSNPNDIKFIELAQDAKDEAHSKLEDIKNYKKENNDMMLDESERVIINVLGSIDDIFDHKLD